MSKKKTTSHYFLTKDKKLEIHENNVIFRAKVPLRFRLNPLEFFKNIAFIIVKSKKRLRPYTFIDQKDNQEKKIYLTHNEILQVWNHPIKEKAPIITSKGKKK
jgi:hypothetical protein